MQWGGAHAPSHVVGVGSCGTELICVRARPVRATDIGALWQLFNSLKANPDVLKVVTAKNPVSYD